MSPRKLSDGDRQEILSLYRNTNETTSTLAIRFGVSSSTVSRFLKNSLTETEYEDLIQEKRLARTAKNEEDGENTILENLTMEKEIFLMKDNQEKQLNLSFEDKIEEFADNQPDRDQDNQEITKAMDQEFKDILAPNTELETEVEETVIQIQEDEEVFELIDEIEEDEDEKPFESLEIEEDEDEKALESVKVLAAMYGEDMEEDIDDDEEDIEDEDIEDEDIERKLIASYTESQLQVFPFDRAIFPRVCYIVIDRYAELVAKPLKDFGHLGNIPSSEFLQLTLPIFDNHKVAKRYCDRRGKVIKVPDGRLLQKTYNHLKSKGITRILMDGKIYSLT